MTPNVWITAMNGDLLRADAIVHLQVHLNGLEAHCLDGRSVRITGTSVTPTFHLALLREITMATAIPDARYTIIIAAETSEQGSVWRRRFVEELIG